MTLAPASLAFMIQRKETGWFSAGLAPMIRITSAILEIYPVVRHCTASERLCQSRNCCAVSNAGLMFNIHQA